MASSGFESYCTNMRDIEIQNIDKVLEVVEREVSVSDDKFHRKNVEKVLGRIARRKFSPYDDAIVIDDVTCDNCDDKREDIPGAKCASCKEGMYKLPDDPAERGDVPLHELVE